MRTALISSFVLAAVAGTASAQLAGINGYSMNYGNGFSHFPGSSISVNGGGAAASAPFGNISVNESIDANQVGAFANRHFAFFSSDGGASPYAYDGVSSFSVTYRHRMSNTVTPPLSGGTNTAEGGLWFLQGGAANSFNDGGIFTVSNRTMFVGGMGAGFGLLAEGNGSNANRPPLTAGGWYTVRFDYWAPGALGAGSLASYQASVLDESTGNFQITPLTSWDQGSSWPTGLQAGTAIGFRFQHAPVVGRDNAFSGEYTNVVIGAVVPTPAAMSVLALGGLAALRRRR